MTKTATATINEASYDISDPESLYGKVLSVPTSKVRISRNDPRTYRSEEQVQSRATSMKSMGQMNPIPVEVVFDDSGYDFEACDGNTRQISAVIAELEYVFVWIQKPFKSDDDRHLYALVANYNRSELIPMDLSNAIMRQVGAGKTQVELAELLGLDPMTVSNYMLLQKLHSKLQKFLHPETSRDEQLAPATAFLLAKVPRDQQVAVYEKAKVEGGRITQERVKLIIEGMGIEVQVRKRELNPVHKRRKVKRILKTVGQQFGDLSKSDQEHILGYLERLGDEERENIAGKLKEAEGQITRLKMIASIAGLGAQGQIKPVDRTDLEGYIEADILPHRDPSLAKNFRLETFLIVHRLNSAKAGE